MTSTYKELQHKRKSFTKELKILRNELKDANQKLVISEKALNENRVIIKTLSKKDSDISSTNFQEYKKHIDSNIITSSSEVIKYKTIINTLEKKILDTLGESTKLNSEIEVTEKEILNLTGITVKDIYKSYKYKFLGICLLVICIPYLFVYSFFDVLYISYSLKIDRYELSLSDEYIVDFPTERVIYQSELMKENLKLMESINLKEEKEVKEDYDFITHHTIKCFDSSHDKSFDFESNNDCRISRSLYNEQF